MSVIDIRRAAEARRAGKVKPAKDEETKTPPAPPASEDDKDKDKK